MDRRTSELAQARDGQVIDLPVTRNATCSSWTTKRPLADRFSGATRDKVGLVVQLVDGKNIQAFIAPPEHTKPWFNALYEKTMGQAFRFKEGEYALCSPSVRVKIVCVKR